MLQPARPVWSPTDLSKNSWLKLLGLDLETVIVNT